MFNVLYKMCLLAHKLMRGSYVLWTDVYRSDYMIKIKIKFDC